MLEVILHQIFRFLSSLKLAVTLLISLAAALAAGTIQESLHDADVAKDVVYHTWWFALLLFFLAVNVACAALSRYPWKRRHTGFVITHAGIILILLGSLITFAYGKNGQMIIRNEQTSNVVLLEKQVLQVQVPGKGIDAVVPVNLLKNKSESVPLAPWSPVSIKLTDRLRSAKEILKVKEEKSGSPGVLIRLSGMMGNIEEWLVLDDPARSQLNVGPAEVLFLKASTAEELEFLLNESNEGNMKGELVLLDNGKETAVKLPIPVDSSISIPGLPYRIRAIDFYQDAGLEGRKLKEQSQSPNNPAFTFEITKNGASETHTVFSRFPEMASFHGRVDSRVFNLDFRYKPLYLPKSGKNSIWIILDPDGVLFYRIKAKGNFTHMGPIFKSKEIRTGWMDFRFSVEDYKSNVIVQSEFRPSGTNDVDSTLTSAIRLEINKKKQGKTVWLGLGNKKSVRIGDDTVRVGYLTKREGLPFSVTLQKFTIKRYEGTNNPMSYESLVEINDVKKNKKFTALIQMNKPLTYGGYKFYQAAFQQEDGVPVASVLAVGQDPGIPFKYIGSIILIIGIGIQFFLKKWLIATEPRKEQLPTLVMDQPLPKDRNEEVTNHENQQTLLVGKKSDE